MLFGIAALLLALAFPAVGEAKWRQASSTHFVIYSEESPDSLRKFAERLERYDSAMRFIRGLADYDPGAANRLTIYVVPDLGTVRRLHGRGSGSIAGFYVPRAGGSIAIVPRRGLGGGQNALDEEGVLRHEYAHHFMFENYPVAFPSWYIEGFAEFHATSEFEDDGSVGIGRPALHRAYGLMSGNPLPLDKMMALGNERLRPDQLEAIYGRGWLLTHYLTFNEQRRPQLGKYLKALNSGKTGTEAATAAFGDLQLLQREVDRYMMQRRMSYMKIPPAKLKTGRIDVRELSAGEDAVMDLKIRSRRGVDDKQARELLPLMRKAAAPFPNDAAVQVTLAEAEFDAGQYKEAIAAADRALAADPKSIDALLYKGRAMLALARDSSEKAKAVAEARKLFAAANRLDPDDPEPLILFYNSYFAGDAKPTANAVMGLNHAFQLAPQDRGLRMMVARQYLVDGKAQEARHVLGPIAFDPHSGGMGAVAAAIIASLDKGGAAAALQRFDTPASEEEAAKDPA
jgi:tetratricopeptide (TPR) repeat protein